tara:strand:- start:120 stop:1019 length:900 start_codon:yes stop_codon:yes gene_type:complete
MIYRAVNELVADSNRRDNVSHGRYIHNETKKNAWGKLNYFLGGEKRKNDVDVHFQDSWSHTVSDVFNYCPMILNYLTLRGYANILFVGHFNVAQKKWCMPRGTDRDIFRTPSHKAEETTMVDPNIWIQFLPLVHQAYKYYSPQGYDMRIHTVVPPESRHRGILHAVYKRYELDLIPITKQYKHSQNALVDITTIQNHKLYDCVVFAGVPKETEDTSFSHHHIRSKFAPLCTPDFDIVDLNYQVRDEAKHIEGARIENTDYLNEVFAIRNIWDDHFRALPEEDKGIEYQILDNIISTYKG